MDFMSDKVKIFKRPSDAPYPWIVWYPQGVPKLADHFATFERACHEVRWWLQDQPPKPLPHVHEWVYNRPTKRYCDGCGETQWMLASGEWYGIEWFEKGR